MSGIFGSGASGAQGEGAASAATNRGEMPLTEHLRELRGCLIKTLIGIAVGAILCYSFIDRIFLFLATPFQESFKGGVLIGTAPAEAFIVQLRVAVAAGIVVSAPWSFYQLWKFVEPGLHEEERRLVIPFVGASTICFFLGIAFCFYLVIPVAFVFFSDEYINISAQPNISLSAYLGFVTKLSLVFGAVFELPVITFFLAKAGIVTSEWLMRHVRYAIVIIFVVAAILTPPDAVSQLLLAVPLLCHYGICILVCKYVEGSSKTRRT